MTTLSIDLVLTDVLMPVMSGPWLAKLVTPLLNLSRSPDCDAEGFAAQGAAS